MNGRVSDAQLFRRFLVAEPLDRDDEALPERRRRSEQCRVEDLHDRPQLAQVVLDRGAGERHLARGRQGANGLGLLGLGVLHVLGLVEHDAPPGHLGQDGLVPGRQGVGGDHDVGCLGQLLEGRFPGPGRAVVHHHRELGGEALGFPRPVAGHRRRADDEGRAARRPLPFSRVRGAVAVLVLEESQHGCGLPQAHVIGQAGTEPETLQHLQPGHATLLVGTQLADREREHLVGLDACPERVTFVEPLFEGRALER